MPSISSRRAFLAGTATAATAIAAGCSPAALAAPDPALDAIAHYRDVHARWLAKLARVTKAHNAACREVGPEPVVTFGRVSERVRSHLHLEEMARKAIKQGSALDELKAAWDTADQAIAEWRERLQEASIRHGVGELEAVANRWCDRDSVALRKAFATPATTPAGFLAMLHLMKEEDEMFFDQPEDGMRALLHSARSLFAGAEA